MQRKVVNLESMVSVHCTIKNRTYSTIMETSCFDTDFAKLASIHCFRTCHQNKVSDRDSYAKSQIVTEQQILTRKAGVAWLRSPWFNFFPCWGDWWQGGQG